MPSSCRSLTSLLWANNSKSNFGPSFWLSLPTSAYRWYEAVMSPKKAHRVTNRNDKCLCCFKWIYLSERTHKVITKLCLWFQKRHILRLMWLESGAGMVLTQRICCSEQWFRFWQKASHRVQKKSCQLMTKRYHKTLSNKNVKIQCISCSDI